MGVLGVNHLALRTSDPARLRRFYAELLAAEELEGEHEPLRAGAVVLAFFPAETDRPAGEDELAFDVDESGFEEALARANRLVAFERGPVAFSDASRAFFARDPDGRRLEFTHNDPGVFWRTS